MELQPRILLVGNVANGTGQIQITIDSALNIDDRARFVDPLSLLFLGRLVVGGERHGATCLSENAPGITGIGAYQQVVGDHEHVGSAALALHHLHRVLVLLHLSNSALCAKSKISYISISKELRKYTPKLLDGVSLGMKFKPFNKSSSATYYQHGISRLSQLAMSSLDTPSI